jgi:hypothetical protein
VAYYRQNLFAHLIKRKQKKFTKPEELYVRPRLDSTKGNTHGGLRRYERMRLLATYAGKERKKMTHSKQTI